MSAKKIIPAMLLLLSFNLFCKDLQNFMEYYNSSLVGFNYGLDITAISINPNNADKRMKKEEIADNLDNYITDNKNSYNKKDEQFYLLKYKSKIKEFFNSYGLCENFLKGSGNLPLGFCTYNDKLTISISGLLSDNTYNTLRSTSKERASSIFSSISLPALINAYKVCDKEIKYIAVTTYYLSKDFSNEIKFAKEENLTVIAKTEDVKAYIDNKITDVEVADKADIFLKDRDMKTDAKKTKLKLE